MGGGLAFLNKKTWHTGGFRMIEEVWKREQEAEHEKRRLEEMKKEIAEERKVQELQQQAIEAGHIEKVERLEFMYKGGLAEHRNDQDDYLLGKKKAELPPEQGTLDKISSAAGGTPASIIAGTPKAANEAWNKLHGDPMLMMKQQEQEARKHIKNNPLKMEQIRKEVAQVREEKASRKAAKKEAKKERKRAIREEVRRTVLGEGRGGGESKKRRGSSCSRSRSQSRSPTRGKRLRSQSPPPRTYKTLRGDETAIQYEGRSWRDGGRQGTRRSRSPNRNRSRSPKHRSRPGKGRYADGDEHKAETEVRVAPGAGTGDALRGPSGVSVSGDKGSGVRDSSCAQDGGKGYGLTYANKRAEEAAGMRREKRAEWREATRKEEALREKVPEKVWQQGKNNVGHRPGKISEEEKSARLQSMMSDADVHEEARWSRLSRAAKDDSKEKSIVEMSISAPERHHSDTAPFMEDAQKRAFGGKISDDAQLEDRVGARRHYAHRGNDAFRR